MNAPLIAIIGVAILFFAVFFYGIDKISKA